MDASKDPRCAYVGNTAAAIIGNPSLAANIAAAPETAKFLNELSCKVLQVISDGKQCKLLAGSVASPGPDYLEVHFVKTAETSQEIEADKVAHQLMVSSSRNNHVHALHAYLSNVYAPVLFGQTEKSAKVDTQLRDLLFSLQAGLQKTLRKGGSSLVHSNFSQDEFRSILSPLDEIECWQENERENVGSAENEPLRRKSELINQAFAKIAGPIAQVDTLELGQISPLVDSMQDALDAIWRD